MQIFISYKSTDRATVSLLAKDLEGFGHQVWFDQQLTGGRQWWDDIVSKIYTCDLFVIALSPALLNSEPCRLEREYALALRKRILPVLISSVDFNLVPTEIKVLQVIKYSQDRQALFDISKALQNLPEPSPLPDTLPTPPDVPVDSLYGLKERVLAVPLPYEEQLVLLHELKRLLAEPATNASARDLLQSLRKNPELRALVADEIATLLRTPAAADSGRDASKPPAAAAERVEAEKTEEVLQEGEQMLAQFSGIVWRTGLTDLAYPIGTLMITNRRLIFRPGKFSLGRRTFEEPLSNIQSATKTRLMGVTPLLEIINRAGTKYTLQRNAVGGLWVGNQEEVLEALQSALDKSE